MTGYVFLQCRDQTCRLRFPAATAEVAGLVCPRCRGPLSMAAVVERAPLTAPSTWSQPPLVALLDNIRSIHNVGSIFRTADGAGLDHLHLVGITATPDHPRLAKAALGAHQTISWTHHRHGPDAAVQLREAGFHLWALERTADPSPQPSLYETPLLPGALALIVGNERAGVDPDLLALCDGVFSLPMTGGKSSLNVAVAFGIAVYHLRFGQRVDGVR